MSVAGSVDQMLEPPYLTGIFVLDNNGGRIAAKYWRDKILEDDVKAQIAFEKRLLAKVAKMPTRSEPDILLFEQYVVVFRLYNDIRIFVMAPAAENELLVLSAFCTVDDSLTGLTGGNMTARILSENMRLVALVIDEVVDDGLIVEVESADVVARLSASREVDDMTAGPDQTLTGALLTVKDQFLKTLRS